jgi:nucleoid DNA-binding protein
MTKKELKGQLALTADTDPIVRKAARMAVEYEFERLTDKLSDYEQGTQMLRATEQGE